MIEEWVGAELAPEGLVERSETHQWNVDGYDGLLLSLLLILWLRWLQMCW